MNNANARMKCSKKAVTPVIATIILIAGTLVLALVVGAYTFGLFGSNVKTITLASATLYGGVTESAAVAATSYLTISLNNPGSATSIFSVTLTGVGISTITFWSTSSSAGTSTINFQTSGAANGMSPGAPSFFTFYPWSSPSQSITPGQTFNYVISFANGQSISGSLVAQ